MALDGAFLRHVMNEIKSTAIGARVDKIYQPNKDSMHYKMSVEIRYARTGIKVISASMVHIL